MKTMAEAPRESRWSFIFFVAALAALLFPASGAWALGGFPNAFLNYYDGSAPNRPAAGPTVTAAANNCTLCHTQVNAGGGAARNPYGTDLQPASNQNLVSRLVAVEPLNSDGDTANGDACSNITEITADTLPGDPNSTPANCAAANQPPVADPNGPYNGTVGIPVAFNGNGSNDPDGTIVQYDWNFGDGTVANNAGPTPSHTYAATGMFTVSLTVTDDAGATDTATTTANIVAAAQDPIADPNGPYSGTTNVALTLNGGASFDPDGGAITQYDWDFGDGNAVSVTTPTVSHTYNAAGTYTVTLTVVDDEGATSAPATTTAAISDAPANQPPVSDPNGPYTGTAGSAVNFNGSGSSDPDGTIVSYAWDFGDGSSGTGVTTTHTYAAAGMYTVSLTVTDNDGATGTASTEATISDAVVCQGLNITQAQWVPNNRRPERSQLNVDGNGVVRNGGDIVLSNAFDLDQVLGTTGVRDRNQFRFRIRNPQPVPCRVRVEQGALCGEADVANAPDDCAPQPPAFGDPTARGDTYATAIGKRLTVQLSRVSGVLYNDFDTDAAGANIGNDGLTAQLISGPANAQSFSFSPDGSFDYTPNATLTDNTNDSFTYQAMDLDGNLSEVATVNIHVMSDQVDFKIMMNYELGMHCTGFEFSYCCVLPPYNSILAQVVRPQPGQGNIRSNADFARLLEGDPNNGLDGLGRETVVRDFEHDGTFQKYYLEYFHDAQPRREGNMPGSFNDQTSTLISDIEGNSMLYHNTPYDSALVDTDGSITGVPGKMVRAGDPGFPAYNGLIGPVVGDGDYTGPADNYANGWLNHFYIYQDLEGSNPNNSTLEIDKIRLGVNGMVVYPANVGAALQPMGPVSSTPVPFDNVLTFSADTGTVVYTQMKVLENLPVMLTSPRIWEALGLPLTPFEDSIGFFAEGPGTGPGSVDEDSIRPYVAMKARLHQAVCDGAGNCSQGPAVVGSNGQPVIGHGSAPIDIPNCERCHSVPAMTDGVPNVNSPSFQRSGDGAVYGPDGLTLEAITNLEINYWKAFYPSLQTGTDWYARLKGAAVNMLAMHDFDIGTGFLDNYPTSGIGEPLNDLLGLPPEKQIAQNTRMGHESVICQKCHGDNVIAAVAPMGQNPNAFRPRPISEAIHRTHRNQSEGGVIVFNDGLGRDGGCQGCHPAHRSDGVMDNYPITTAGNNANAGGDNRLNQGGCFVGRDVHSNPLKDVDGAETPEHLNAVGEWLADNVFYNQAGEPGGDADNRGIWCTNCHTQIGQDMWAAEDCDDLINSDPNNPSTANCINNVRALPTLDAIATAVGLPDANAVIERLDPRSDPANPMLPFPGYSDDFSHAIWRTDIADANVATIEFDPVANTPVGTTDADGDFSVNILSFCTTDDCVNTINANKGNENAWRYPEGGTVDGRAGFIDTANEGVPVPFSAATDGRDHWLAAGEPHCADCHAAPYVEQSGNINPFPPFNYPAKASLMRYSRGHQDLGCQACHESIHGLYPVTAAIDTTTYAQAAALNHDGSHGPLKCGSCHQVNGLGIPDWHEKNNDGPFSFGGTLDAAITFAHTFTDEANPLDSLCQNCHGDERNGINANEEEWLEHAMVGRTSRLMMDKAEIARRGHILGTDSPGELNQLCSTCHDNELDEVSCDGEWRRHLTQGRVSEVVWEEVSLDRTGTTCGW